MTWPIGEYSPEMSFLSVDTEYLASKPNDIQHKTVFVRQCYRCGALIMSESTYQHDEYHRVNDMNVEED